MTEDRDVTAEAAEIAESLRPTLIRRAGFMSLGVLLLLVSAAMFIPMLPSINYLAFPFFLIGGKLFYLGADSLPLLEWDERGIIDRTSILGESLFIPWSDIDSVSTGQVHSGVRLNLRRHPKCFEILGPGRYLQRFITFLRGFRGIEINPSFTGLDYRRLGRVLDELVTEAQVREVREGKAAGEVSARSDVRTETES